MSEDYLEALEAYLVRNDHEGAFDFEIPEDEEIETGANLADAPSDQIGS